MYLGISRDIYLDMYLQVQVHLLAHDSYEIGCHMTPRKQVSYGTYDNYMPYIAVHFATYLSRYLTPFKGNLVSHLPRYVWISVLTFPGVDVVKKF